MSQTKEQIDAHIGETQQDLHSNLQELEQKVKSVIDWKQQFQANPMAMIGAAFGGGIMLAAMMGGGRRRRAQRSYSSDPEPSSWKKDGTGKAMETWDNVKSALLGVAATRFTTMVEGMVPGFQEQFQRTAENKSNLASTMNAN